MKVQKLPNQKPIIGLKGLTVGDFWSWAYSDLMHNLTRGIFAEYLVATALKRDKKPRGAECDEWESFDLKYRRHKLEIKTTGARQSWQGAREKRPLSPFDIETRYDRDGHGKVLRNKPARRHADCYIFCIHKEKSAKLANPLDVKQWDFYVVRRKVIDERFGDQKSLSPGRLPEIANAVNYDALKSTITKVLR